MHPPTCPCQIMPAIGRGSVATQLAQKARAAIQGAAKRPRAYSPGCTCSTPVSLLHTGGIRLAEGRAGERCGRARLVVLQPALCRGVWCRCSKTPRMRSCLGGMLQSLCPESWAWYPCRSRTGLQVPFGCPWLICWPQA